MTVILVAHILVAIVLIVVVLMQRSEGGALGIGGGGGGGAGGGLMSGRGVAGTLVNVTIIFGAIFFITSLVLTTISTRSNLDGRTEIEQNLSEEFGSQPVEDELGLGDVDDIFAPDPDVLRDPLSQPEAPAPEDDPEASDNAESGDPLEAPQ